MAARQNGSNANPAPRYNVRANRDIVTSCNSITTVTVSPGRAEPNRAELSVRRPQTVHLSLERAGENGDVSCFCMTAVGLLGRGKGRVFMESVYVTYFP